MRPGIIVQHGRLPARSRELVRCDVTAIIGFVSNDNWPEDAVAGDFIEIVLNFEVFVVSTSNFIMFDHSWGDLESSWRSL